MRCRLHGHQHSGSEDVGAAAIGPGRRRVLFLRRVFRLGQGTDQKVRRPRDICGNLFCRARVTAIWQIFS